MIFKIFRHLFDFSPRQDARPDIVFDSKVQKYARHIIKSHRQLNPKFRLIGRMDTIGFSFRQAAVLETVTQDVVKSSEIEGEILDYSLVRSSVARHLGVETAAEITQIEMWKV